MAQNITISRTTGTRALLTVLFAVIVLLATRMAKNALAVLKNGLPVAPNQAQLLWPGWRPHQVHRLAVCRLQHHCSCSGNIALHRVLITPYYRQIKISQTFNIFRLWHR